MIVYQVVPDVGPPPPKTCLAWMATARAYADRIGVEYRLETRTPWYAKKFKRYQLMADIMRLEFAIDNAPCMYIDWDVEVFDSMPEINQTAFARKGDSPSMFYMEKKDIHLFHTMLNTFWANNDKYCKGRNTFYKICEKVLSDNEPITRIVDEYYCHHFGRNKFPNRTEPMNSDKIEYVENCQNKLAKPS